MSDPYACEPIFLAKEPFLPVLEDVGEAVVVARPDVPDDGDGADVEHGRVQLAAVTVHQLDVERLEREQIVFNGSRRSTGIAEL